MKNSQFAMGNRLYAKDISRTMKFEFDPKALHCIVLLLGLGVALHPSRNRG